MATEDSLYRQLFNSRLSDDLSRRKYIPNSELRKIVATDNIITELHEHQKRWSLKRIRQNSTNLATRILESGQKLFVILVNLTLSWGVKNLLDAGLTDEDLPLSKRGNHLYSSVDPARSFKWPSEWGLEKLDDFVEKQWLVLAPVFSPSLVVALKEFKFKEDFEKERNNLNRIRGLSLNKHIIQNFETFSQGNKTYIMFPWAEGGDLDNFWKDEDTKIRSPQLALWCLQQMLGLAEALEFLHNQIGERANFRHGDLKPGNILHFLTGGPYGILKIADFGISRIHDVATLQRQGIATTTRATTPSYEAPEAIYTDRPRSRKFDIWSLGCIFLEFTIWFVRDWEAVENFGSARKPTSVGHDKAHFYQMKATKAKDSTEVHPAVVDNIASLRSVAQSDKDTAFVEVLEIIELNLLRIEVEDRVDAKELCELLSGVLKRAQGDQD
ncbi:hypothetical protein INS49_010498 [Diaporthe citri]|uniref:uncharacterized protein n=1 Tax=Diaporthe citri TaxID=83186 RepID=UPI001C7F3F74|nr:uncharacterized protein INS49_010498 [Diaporthe citri]KAG6362268.1 hypothetical protein INS49_010498 [Diaporthe citri]